MSEPATALLPQSTRSRPWNFRQRVAVVTGGSRGIGRALVLALSEAGAQVVFTYRSSGTHVDDVLSRVAEGPGEAVGLAADVREPPDLDRVIDTALNRFGQLDFLINNAGVIADSPLYTMTEAQWSVVIETNLTAAFRLTRRALRALARSQAGRVVSVASVSGLVGVAGQTNYAAAKAGVIGLTKALAKEVGRLGITVNAVAPGYIDTDMLHQVSGTKRTDLTRRIPVGRLGTPDDVAHAVCFLLSDEAAYITGHVLVVDGGLS